MTAAPTKPAPGALVLFDHRGDPIMATRTDSPSGNPAPSPIMTFIDALRTLDKPAILRSRDPLTAHAWVYIAARALAINLSQAPLRVWSETQDVQNARAEQAVRTRQAKSAAAWHPPCGRKRAFAERHWRDARRGAVPIERTLEPIPNHWLSAVLRRPNRTINTSAMLTQAMVMNLTLRGECPLLPITEDGRPWLPGFDFTDLATLNPDRLEADTDLDGRLLGWDYWTTPPDGSQMDRKVLHSGHIYFLPDEVVMPRYWNPKNPLRGLAPLTACAMGIRQDVQAQDYNLALLENDAEPGGILLTKARFPDDKARGEFKRQWTERHSGKNRRQVGLLEGGMEYLPTSALPKDLEFLEMMKWHRDEILAALGPVPKSVVSITDDLNLAISQTQDRAFWNKALKPISMTIEDVFEQTLLFGEPDSIGVGYDLTGVEALQDDLAQKAETANKMITTGRVPPRTAWTVLKVDMPKYPGDDRTLVSPMLATVESVIDMSDNPPNPVEPDPSLPASAPEEGNDDDSPTAEQLRQNKDSIDSSKLRPHKIMPGDPYVVDEEAKSFIGVRSGKLIDPHKVAVESFPHFHVRRGTTAAAFQAKASVRRAAIGVQYIKLCDASEPLVAAGWKKHIGRYRSDQLDAFDAYIKRAGIDKALRTGVQRGRAFNRADIEASLIPAADMNPSLRSTVGATFPELMDRAVEFTAEELGGMFVFDVQSAEVDAFLNSRLTKVTGLNRTVRGKLVDSLNQGVLGGETLDELRGRIGAVFNRQVSARRMTTIARTETSQMFGGTRDIIFDEEGVTKHEWTTAGDEHVREDHVKLGKLPEKKRDFNYMSALNKPGTLMYANDPEGPADQVINCRCVSIAKG